MKEYEFAQLAQEIKWSIVYLHRLEQKSLRDPYCDEVHITGASLKAYHEKPHRKKYAIVKRTFKMPFRNKAPENPLFPDLTKAPHIPDFDTCLNFQNYL